MSLLSENLKELKTPKRASNFKKWLDSLSDEDRVQVLEAIHDTSLKNYPLFEALKKSGMHVSKDWFFNLRAELLDGSLKDEDIR